MIQFILVGILVLGATLHIGRKIYLNVTGKDSPGCEKCAVKEISEGNH